MVIITMILFMKSYLIECVHSKGVRCFYAKMKGIDIMIITGMKEFENIIHHEAVKYFNENREKKITEADVFTVWSCKTLQNYKALVSTNVAGDATYFEFTYNGDKQQLYMDSYVKEKNACIE